MKKFKPTHTQETMLLEAAADPFRYVTVLRYELSKSTDAAALTRRLALLSDRHEALRSVFVRDEEGAFRQEITDCIDDKLFKIELRGDELTVTFRHALLDGWSVGIIMRELLADIEPRGKAPTFRHYAKWLGQRDYAGDLSWWKQYLDGCNAGSGLPNAASGGGYERNELCFTIQNPELLRQRASELRITAGRLLQSVWCMLVARYNDGESVVCTVNAGRSAPVPGVTEIVGMCLNTLPILTKLPKPPASVPFADWVSEWSRSAAEAERHGFCALGDLVSAMPHLLTIEPPFDGEGYKLKSSNARLVTDFDAVFTLGGKIEAKFAYNTRVYSDETVKLIRGHFLRSLNAVLQNPRLAMEEIPILTDAEVSELTAPNEDKNILESIGRQTVVDFWHESVKAHENRAALVCGDVRLSYAELAEAVNRLASALKSRGVGAETPVAIVLPRSERYVIAELAVMAAGGLFIPLDPEWPDERIKIILDEIKPHIVIDDAFFTRSAAIGVPPVGNSPAPEDAAYMIMTSGTTGVPKGVVVTHRNLANFCLWAKARYGWRAGDACALVLGFSFDASFWDIFLPLISGGTLHILRDGARFSMAALGGYCKVERITHLNLPVTLNDSFREIYRGENALPDLRVMVTGNEEVRQVVPAPYPLSNEYGPTECTVTCSLGWLDGNSPVTVGSPPPNMNAYILDEWGRLCPDGVTGEACFAGVQVARGYYNAPDLTSERFIDNPFGNDNDNYKTIYRSGDLMQWRRFGGCRKLVFRGRADNQVKINGFRVELGEIESVLRSHQGVSAVHAVVKGTEEKRLCAYVVSDGDVSELNARLASKLPFYMRPAIVLVEKMPLTSNGKIDEEKLPFPEPRHAAECAPPATESERALLTAISRVLNVENIGMNDNYLALGGNSINAMRIASRLEKEGWELAAKGLLISGSLAEAAAAMRRAPDRPAEAPVKEAAQNTFTPLAAQQAIFFLTKTAGPDIYAVTLKVNAEGLDPDTLNRRLDKAVELHDILRATFEPDETGRVVGIVHDVPPRPAVQAKLCGEELIIRYHHIALDGWSVNLLLDELLHGKFPQNAPSFASFANRLAGQTARQTEDEAWWREQCKNAQAVPLLPPRQKGKPDLRRVRVNTNTPAGLADAAQKARVTRLAFALAAWGVVLHTLAACDGNILVPFVASCRDDDNLMGMCAAAHPLSFRMTDATFGELARNVQDVMLESVSHWFVPQDIIGRLPRYLFVFEDGAEKFSAVGEQNYDLIVKFSGDVELIYNSACLPEIKAQSIASRLEAALSSAGEDKISAFHENEYELVTKTFAHGRTLDAAYPTAAEAFRLAAKRYADLAALETETLTLTYGQLYERAKRYAEELNSQGIGAGDVVPFCLPRGADAIIAQLGITLSGAAFLPLDPEWPEGRRGDILSDSSKAKVPPDTAYVIYTSGTTGKPKGVAVPQAALANQIAWSINEFGFDAKDKILHYVAFTFDPSVWTLFTALCSGASVSLVRGHTRLDPDAVARQIRDREITVCVFAASVGVDILRRAGGFCLPRLRLAFLGAEPIKNLPPRAAGLEVINLYGPTETCVNATFRRLRPEETETRNIGRPVANTRLYVLDARENPCPVGIQGELYIGGVQLAHGYLNRPEESAAAFAEHPLFGRLYRTGDFAAWNEDGTLEFYGRRDNQVKIRGHRVELGEIEQALCAIPGVLDARVKLTGDVPDAYVIRGKDAPAPDVSLIRRKLSARLPAYMLPRAVTVMDAFPLTENGKVDFTALPPPAIEPVPDLDRRLSEMEKAVAEAWKTALGLASDFTIGRGGNFYDLGGHSLLLFHVVGLLAARGITADIRTLVEYPQLDELAAAIGRQEQTAAPKVTSASAADAETYGQYVQKMKSLDLTETRSFHHILITGGTGFLGCHLAREFYANTGAVIHLPVRGGTKKLSDTLLHYFHDLGGEMAVSERIRVYASDISERPPDIDAPLDAIFHTAADIRHYAPEHEMVKANVTATENMLELAGRHAAALFAHASTTSAVNAPVIHECDTDLGPAFENIYQRTKQIAEGRVLDAGKSGLKYAVFRIGHVSPGYESGSVARNWEINAMLRLINAMLLTGLLPERDYKIGYGYADKIALALRLLSTPVNLKGLVFHIDNPNSLRLSELFKLAGLSGQIIPGDELAARLRSLAETGDGPTKQAAAEYLGRVTQGGLERDSADIVAGELRMDATLLLLKRTGFKWPRVTAGYVQNILRHLKGGMTNGR